MKGSIYLQVQRLSNLWVVIHRRVAVNDFVGWGTIIHFIEYKFVTLLNVKLCRELFGIAVKKNK